MLDIPLDVETKAFLLSFAGAFLGLLMARALCLLAQWTRRPHRAAPVLRYTPYTLRPPRLGR